MILSEEKNESMDETEKIGNSLMDTPPEGLTEQEAKNRLERGLGNKDAADDGKTVGQILRENLLTLFNLLNLCLAVCVALVGRFQNMLFMGVVISNTVIGTWQELRARNTIKKLQVLNAPTAHILREGQEKVCRSEEVVQGDLVILRAGDQVLADGPVTDGAGFADQSLLTGESDPVEKKPGDSMMSGSFVTEGHLVFRAEKVGEERYAAKVTREGKEIRRPQSLLMKDLNRIIRFVSFALVPLGIALFLKEFLADKEELADAVCGAVGAMVGMIPEGLILLTSVALYVGVFRLGRHHTLAQEMVGIETLARADVLCLDKTGTLTTGGMSVHHLVPLEMNEEKLKEELGGFSAAFDDHSGTLDAIRAFAGTASVQVTARLPFSSTRKLSAASFSTGETIVVGAPEFMPRGTLSEAVFQQVNEIASQGFRVLAVCGGQEKITGNTLPRLNKVCGLVVLQDTLRDSVRETLEYFEQEDVVLKIISGDNPRTVSAVAHRAGLKGWDSWVDASTLDTDESLLEAVDKYTVFGRVTPSQKRKLVEALKKKGHHVAMTGDGVNDIPALKAADCSIAMAGGSDATRCAAQIVLLDNDFASLPAVVAEGRRVVGNISRTASLFLVKTMYSFCLAVLTLLSPGSYPFQPIQLTMISSLTIGFPGFVLSLLPNVERISGDFLKKVLKKAIPGAVAVTVCAAAAMAMVNFNVPKDACSSMAAVAAGIVGLAVLFQVCRPLELIRTLLFLSMCIAFVGAVALIGSFFMIDVSLLQEDWKLALCLIAAALAVFVLVSAGMGFVDKRAKH